MEEIAVQSSFDEPPQLLIRQRDLMNIYWKQAVVKKAALVRKKSREKIEK